MTKIKKFKSEGNYEKFSESIPARFKDAGVPDVKPPWRSPARKNFVKANGLAASKSKSMVHLEVPKDGSLYQTGKSLSGSSRSLNSEPGVSQPQSPLPCTSGPTQSPIVSLQPTSSVSLLSPSAAQTGDEPGAEPGQFQILVNPADISHRHRHQEEVMSLLQPCEIIKLTVQHDPLPPGFMEVTVNKAEGEKLGMIVKGGLRGQPGNPLDPADEGVFCVKVNPGSIASYSRIKVSRSYIKCFNIKVFHESLYLLMSF